MDLAKCGGRQAHLVGRQKKTGTLSSAPPSSPFRLAPPLKHVVVLEKLSLLFFVGKADLYYYSAFSKALERLLSLLFFQNPQKASRNQVKSALADISIILNDSYDKMFPPGSHRTNLHRIRCSPPFHIEQIYIG